jgi:hypothetical protein
MKSYYDLHMQNDVKTFVTHVLYKNVVYQKKIILFKKLFLLTIKDF